MRIKLSRQWLLNLGWLFGLLLFYGISTLVVDLIPNPIYIYIYIYIYIFTNLLSTSIHGFQEKENKTPEFRDNNISDRCLGKKNRGKKKEKANFVIPVKKKIKGYAVSWSKEQKPTVKCCNATITNSAQY